MSLAEKTSLSHLPEVRGRYTENATLGEKGWFRCGGTADILFKPADKEDLQNFLKNCPSDIPVYIFGALSNTIIRDGGLRGVVIRFGREFADIKAQGDVVTAGALALDANVAQVAADSGLGGLEFFSGIPGSVGGALRMNAGCYGTETKDVLIDCEAMDRAGNIIIYTPDQMGMTYRHIDVPEDVIFLSARFKGVQENPETVKKRMAEIKEKREQSQPIREKTGGSTFANPSAAELSQAGLSEDTKVWQLIDGVGGRGLQIGGAQMSEKHCNFMINTGTATAADLEALGEEIRSRVLEKHGITLRWEIRRIGEP
ncbi:MAG TPA: UDP-N-acetylmuramate dehydrogenase [Alphaproteobacteria bacterium]|nr:UDP-N-acetylmuramate dehydrogenase [Alphaproteobacteria bacterium]